MFREFLEANKHYIITFAIMTAISIGLGLAVTGDFQDALARRHRS